MIVCKSTVELDKMRAAYDFGADAVYAGQPRYSLRARNNEFRLEQIKQGIDEAHARGKKFFVTSNLIAHNDKIRTYLRDIEPVIDCQPDALIMADAGLIVLTAFISPFRAERHMVRRMVPEGEFIEIFVDTPLAEAEKRDTKGLYKKARAGELKNFTGIDSPYEPPEDPEIRIDTTKMGAEEAADLIVEELLKRR